MKKTLKLIIAAFAFILLFAAAVILYTQLSEKYEPELTVPPVNSGDSSTAGSQKEFNSPDFTVLDSDGNEVRLSDFAGEPIVINFWATWCPPCRAELPDFNEMYTKYGNDVNFLMVNLTDGISETIEGVKSFVSQEGYTFPVYYDTQSDASSTYSVYSIPLTLFIDKSGNIVGNHVGAMSGQTLESYLLRLLGQTAD
ncbi:MAG: TlpA family protein disulfide reductase [Eubacteriales bacterium]